MAKPTKLDLPYVQIHCRRLAAALLSVGVDFAKGVPPATRVVSDGGAKLDPPEETYYFDLKTRDKYTHTKSLMEAWEDVAKLGEDGHLDATSFLNERLAELREATKGNPAATKALNQIEAILPCVAVSYMRAWAINYGKFVEAQKSIVSYDRIYQRVDRRKQRKRELQRQRDKINAELRVIDRQLADKPAKHYFPQLRLHHPDDKHERSA